MSHVESAILPSFQITSSWRLALKWFGTSVIAVPLSVLLHELGHLVAYLAFGFEGVALHYSSATHALERTFWQHVYRGNLSAAALLLPPWKVGLATAAGILVTCAVTLLCCLIAVKKNPHPLLVALGIFSSLRFISGIPVMLSWFLGKPVRGGTDEAHLAVLTGIPVVFLVFAGLLFLLVTWTWFIRSIPKNQFLISLPGLVLGIATGWFLYFWLVGPWLLP